MKKILLLIVMLLLPLSTFNTVHAESPSSSSLPNTYIENYDVPIYSDSSSSLNSNILGTSGIQPNIMVPVQGGGAEKVGTVHFSVNPYTNVISYNVTMTPGFIFGSFSGHIYTVDLSSGFSLGSSYITGRSGHVNIRKLKYHYFYSTLSGKVLSTGGIGSAIPGSSYLYWECKG